MKVKLTHVPLSFFYFTIIPKLIKPYNGMNACPVQLCWQVITTRGSYSHMHVHDTNKRRKRIINSFGSFGPVRCFP